MKPKIPKGWRKLRKGTRLKHGDRCKCLGNWFNALNISTSKKASKWCRAGWSDNLTYIRRKGKR